MKEEKKALTEEIEELKEEINKAQTKEEIDRVQLRYTLLEIKAMERKYGKRTVK